MPSVTTHAVPMCHCQCNGTNHGVGKQQARENAQKDGVHVERAGALYLVSQNPPSGSPGAGAPVYHDADLREQPDVLSGEHHYIPTSIGGSPKRKP